MVDFETFVQNCDMDEYCPNFGNYSGCEECYEYVVLSQQE